MYYLGFLAQDPKHVVIFKSLKTPKKDSFKYFTSVSGPYETEVMARYTLKQLKQQYGYKENPCGCTGKGHKQVGKTKNAMSPEKALRLTRKVYGYAKDVYKDYQENPGQSYHDQKFLGYMKELEKYKLGSVPYIGTLAKAYEHLESAKES